MKHLLILTFFFLMGGTSSAQTVDPVLQRENLSGTNTLRKLRTVLDWEGLASLSNIPTSGAITNNGQIVSTPSSGFQYSITYVRETGYTGLTSGISTAFKYDYRTSAAYGLTAPLPKQRALEYGPVCSSLQVAGAGSYRMEVVNTAGGAVPLQFSIVDLDLSETIRIMGYNGATYVRPTLVPRTALLPAGGGPSFVSNPAYEQVRAGFSSNRPDFIETSVVDVYFTSPVDRVFIRQTINASSGGYTLFTNFKAITSVDVAKSAGMVIQTASGPPVPFEIPYTIELANKETNGLNINNVQVSENLTIPFPMPTASSVTIKPGTFNVTAPGGSGIAANPLFNGVTNFALLNGTGILRPGQSATINFTAVVTYPTIPDIPTTDRNNQVFVTGMPFGVAAPNSGGTYSGSTWTTPINTFAADTSTNGSLPVTANADIPSLTPVRLVWRILATSNLRLLANLKDQQVELKWQTDDHAAALFFNVEKSTDNILWKKIATTAANNNYSYTDRSPVPGPNYYRISEMTTAGKIIYSNIAVINGKRASGNISVFPNPVINTAIVSLFDKTPGNKLVKVYNSSGSEVLAGNIAAMSVENNFKLDGMQKLPAGAYMVVVYNRDGVMIGAQKIIKK